MEVDLLEDLDDLLSRCLSDLCSPILELVLEPEFVLDFELRSELDGGLMTICGGQRSSVDEIDGDRLMLGLSSSCSSGCFSLDMYRLLMLCA